MKKTSGTLKLKSETVRRLHVDELRQANAGMAIGLGSCSMSMAYDRDSCSTVAVSHCCSGG